MCTKLKRVHMEDKMMMSKKDEEIYYLVKQDILPEAIIKTIEAKKLLISNEASTVFEAVERVGLSRSAFYKYRDGVFPFNAMMKEKIITISMDLEHRSGLLSKVLSLVAQLGGNILTINQSIPLQEIANIILSIDTVYLQEGLTELVEALKKIDGVRKVQIIGRG